MLLAAVPWCIGSLRWVELSSMSDAFRWKHSLILLFCSWSFKPTTSKASSFDDHSRHHKNSHCLVAAGIVFVLVEASGTRSSPAPSCYNVNGRINKDILLAIVPWCIGSLRCFEFYVADAFRCAQSYCYIALAVWSQHLKGIIIIDDHSRHRKNLHCLVAAGIVFVLVEASGTRSSPAPSCYNVNGRLNKDILLAAVPWCIGSLRWVELSSRSDAFRWKHSLILLYYSWSVKPTPQRYHHLDDHSRHQKNSHCLVAAGIVFVLVEAEYVLAQTQFVTTSGRIKKGGFLWPFHDALGRCVHKSYCHQSRSQQNRFPFCSLRSFSVYAKREGIE